MKSANMAYFTAFRALVFMATMVCSQKLIFRKSGLTFATLDSCPKSCYCTGLSVYCQRVNFSDIMEDGGLSKDTVRLSISYASDTIIPEFLLDNATSLRHLDLSHNCVAMLPVRYSKSFLTLGQPRSFYLQFEPKEEVNLTSKILIDLIHFAIRYCSKMGLKPCLFIYFLLVILINKYFAD